MRRAEHSAARARAPCGRPSPRPPPRRGADRGAEHFAAIGAIARADAAADDSTVARLDGGGGGRGHMAHARTDMHSTLLRSERGEAREAVTAADTLAAAEEEGERWRLRVHK